jgi:hypothetical protein
MFNLIAVDFNIITIAYELSLIDRVERKNDLIYSMIINNHVEDILKQFNYHPLTNFFIISLQ